MKTALIITGGEFHEIDIKTSYDFVIACDRGVGYAAKLGIKPDVVLGDFDSYDGDMTRWAQSAELITYPVEKDDTDTMLAVKLAFERGYTHMIIVCALGGRMDHLIANIQALHYIASFGGVGEIISGNEHLRTLSAGEGTLRVAPFEDYSLSLFALSDRVEGLSISGCKYNVENITLASSFPLGHGNSIECEEAIISIKSGVLLVVESSKRDELK